MSEQMVIDNEFFTMIYYSDKKIVRHTIHKQPTVDDFRGLMNQGTALLEKHGATKWMSDDRNAGPPEQEMITWSFSDWIPRTLAAGWKYWALVVPNEVEARAAMAPVINAFYDQGLRIMVFTKPEDALAWLDKM